MAFMWLFYYFLGGDTVFYVDAPKDGVFHVDLQKDKNYELWVVDMNGPETVILSISNGSYVPYGDTFRLMHPEGDYLPYHPAFTVKETGEYDIMVRPMEPGTVRIKIQQDAGLNLNRVMRIIHNII
jgi:hypothetical protein